MKCRLCGTPLQIGNNWWISSCRSQDYRCVACCSERNKEYNRQHASLKSAHNIAYYRLHRAKIRARNRSCYRKNPRTILEQERTSRRELKAACIKKFGGECTCCREHEQVFLTLGHRKEGDGAKHRLALTGHSKSAGGSYFYHRLLHDELDPKFPVQLECFNCNNAKRSIGKLRQEVILAYGGRCECCGETRTTLLTLGIPKTMEEGIGK